jgi:cell wall assembly regulator SMI1
MKNKILFENIIKWQIENNDLNSNCLREPINANSIDEIEKLLGEKFPVDLLELYAYSDGQIHDTSIYAFLGLEFMDSLDIINHIKFCKSLIKGAFKKSNKSDALIEEIVAFYIQKSPPKSFLGFTKKWYKLNAKIGVDYFEGPYLYKTKSSTKYDKIPIKIDDYSPIREVVSALHKLENNSWDKICITIYHNGNYEVNRTNFEYDIPKSNPSGKIKEINFHEKWIPFLHDSTGNYIAYDLDPDHLGNKGQIIIFGKDEYENYLIADSLTSFLKLIYDELSSGNIKNLINKIHLFENLKKIRRL